MRTVAIDARSFDLTAHAIEIGEAARRELAGWLVVLRDVTDRLRSEAERRTLERRLLEQQRVESLSLLASGLAHDFNSLLTAIIGNVDLLTLDLPATSPQREMVEAIAQSATHATELVQKMLAYAGKAPAKIVALDVEPLVHEMVALGGRSFARHCEVVFESTSPLPRVPGDPTQVRQILLNLIANAAEATGRGGRITVRATAQTLTLEALHLLALGDAAAPGEFVCLSVRDTGRGMAPDTVSRVFDPFFTTKTDGTGLGLASVLGIVRSHRGAVQVESALGQGATFKVWLPVRDERRPGANEPAPGAVPYAVSSGDGTDRSPA